MADLTPEDGRAEAGVGDDTQQDSVLRDVSVRIAEGDAEAGEELMLLAYDELRQLAGVYLRKHRPGQTLQPTALVHEAYLRLSKNGDSDWEGRRHFFGAAANAMRQIIVEHARRRLALKRGGDRSRVELHDPVFQLDASPEDLLALDEALASLEDKHPRLSRVVVLRYFGGLSEEDAAQVLEVSPRTLRRDWVLAKAFLAEALEAATERSNPL